jgi:hypothetical protein
MSAAYEALINRKLAMTAPTGLIDLPSLPGGLFDFQSALTSWALRRGRCALFADTGLGKTWMEIAWAKAVFESTSSDLLILTPLAVAAQTVEIAARMGITITHCREQSDVRPGINITNYDRLHKFDTKRFDGVVLDESSCIKHHDSRTLQFLIDAFAHSTFKLCASATPAPNDWTELGTHAEFLGICKRVEMLAEFFVHDGGDTQVWRLKGHARKQFWRWVSTWGALVRNPADIGFDGSAYILPPLEIHEHIVESDNTFGDLFAKEAQSLSERRGARKQSLDERVAACVDQVAAEPHEPWVVWCDLNAEGDALTAAIPGAVQVAGADEIDVKESRLLGFAQGEFKTLVSKASICGWGLNWQHAARMAFVGVTDSFESYYQALRRCYRFGQTRSVHAHIFASEAEGAVVANLKRKERDATAMAEALSLETRDAIRAEIVGSHRHTNSYDAHKRVATPNWLKTDAA